MVNVILQLYLVSVDTILCVHGMWEPVAVCASKCMCDCVACLAANFYLNAFTEHTHLCVCVCVCDSASCHLCWCDNAFRPIKLTGEIHPAYVLYSVN